MGADDKPGRGRMKRRVLIGVGVLLIVGSAGGYLGYRMLFHKNPDVVREIKAADDRQKALDDVFDSPAPAK